MLEAVVLPAFLLAGTGNAEYFWPGWNQSLMANVLWDLPLSACECAFGDLRSFLGAGLGYDWQQMHSSNSCIVFTQRWRHFSWQVVAGLAYPFYCNTELSLEYKFHLGGCHFYNHTIGLGLLYKFGLPLN